MKIEICFVKIPGRVIEALYLHVVYPLYFVGITASSFMMAAMAHERSTAICSKNTESWCNLTRYLSLVLIPALIINLPMFFEFTWEKDSNDVYAFLPSDFTLEPNYIRCHFKPLWLKTFLKVWPFHKNIIFFNFKNGLAFRDSSSKIGLLNWLQILQLLDKLSR